MMEIPAFEYVVKRRAKQRVTFGTSQERNVSLLRPKFDRAGAKYVPELFPNLSPFSYNIEKKTEPKYGAHFSRLQRFKRKVDEGPPPNNYDYERFPKPVSVFKIPFNRKTGREDRSGKKRDFAPGPGTYNPKDDFVHYLSYYQKFGRKKIKVKPPDDTKEITVKCGICSSAPIKRGEPFWKAVCKGNDVVDVMCCECMENLQKDALRDLKKRALTRCYKLMCECPFYSRHAGKPNHRVLMDLNFTDELPKEAYFDKFLHSAKDEENDRSLEGFTLEHFRLLLEEMLVEAASSKEGKASAHFSK